MENGKHYLFTSESVSEGHPDKVSDQIADAILDEFLRQDENAKVACESFCTTGMVVVMGEVCSEAYVDIQAAVRSTINRIGYNNSAYMFDGNSCGVLSALHEQSEDISRGVVREAAEEQGAGDQGMMFGFACKETPDYMPLPIYLSHRILQELARIRHNEPELMPYLRPDAKSQFTVEYDAASGKPVRVHTLVLSTQHDEFGAGAFAGLPYAEAVARGGQAAADEAMRAKIEEDVRKILIPRLTASLPKELAAFFDADLRLLVNPTGKFVIGGPAGDTGLTGRKIIVDTYGGRSSHGGGSFSGKDPSKVDRSATYAARYIAKNMVAAGVAEQLMVQLSYAIGVARPVSVFINTFGTAARRADGTRLSDSEIAERVTRLFDLRPAKIIEKFGLKNPIYSPTAVYGHFGRQPYTAKVKLLRGGQEVERELRFFGWEELDSVPAVKAAFGL